MRLAEPKNEAELIVWPRMAASPIKWLSRVNSSLIQEGRMLTMSIERRHFSWPTDCHQDLKMILQGERPQIFNPLKSASIASPTTFSIQAHPHDETLPMPTPKPALVDRAREKSTVSPSL